MKPSSSQVPAIIVPKTSGVTPLLQRVAQKKNSNSRMQQPDLAANSSVESSSCGKFRSKYNTLDAASSNQQA